MEHQAIYNTHSNVVSIRAEVPYDADNNEVTINQSLVDVELATLQSSHASTQYQRDRQYAPTGDQLDMLWHSIDAGEFGDTTKQSEFYTANKAVKDANPKP
jgi:hypothetical protein